MTPRSRCAQVLDEKADIVAKVLQTAGVVSLQVRRLPLRVECSARLTHSRGAHRGRGSCVHAIESLASSTSAAGLSHKQCKGAHDDDGSRTRTRLTVHVGPCMGLRDCRRR